MKSRLDRLLYVAALAAGLVPLWVGEHLPMVDLPQHLHLISVLHRLNDPSTLYPRLFELRSHLTPYVGYYYAVHLINWLFPLVIANKLFLSLYVAGMPLSVAFLLRSLGRPSWPSLLALPFAYGDSFSWGFINYCSALPLTLFSLGLFLRVLTGAGGRYKGILLLSSSLVAVLLFHVQLYAYLGLTLPLLLIMTRASPVAAKEGWLKPRLGACLAIVPSALLFFIWVVGRLGEPSEVDPGAPWKAWGPMLSSENLAYKTLTQNLRDLPEVLANALRDGSDRWALYAVTAIAVAGWLVAIVLGLSQENREGPIERWRLAALAGVALLCFFALPFDIRGYVYYLNTRYAHLAAPLLLATVPPVGRHTRVFLGASAAASVFLAVPLAVGVVHFNQEAADIDRLSSAVAPMPMIMGLIFNPASSIVNHPVFLHSATIPARERGGATNFSFASTPHSPIKYRTSPPPTFPSEWRPGQFDYARQGGAYEYFMIRGLPPEQVLGSLLSTELEVVARAGSFSLVRRRH